MCSTVGVFSTVRGYHDAYGGGVILSTVGDTQYRGGYHDARGDIMSTVGKIFCYLSTPRVINTPTVLMISPTVLKLQRMVSPHNTHNIPHVHHDIPHGTEYPPWHSRYPTFIMIPPRYCTHAIQGEKVYWEGKRLAESVYFQNRWGAHFA